jgi:hypothetical protein
MLFSSVALSDHEKPKNLLIYYGWLNSFNSCCGNAWTNEKVAQDIARYDLVVIGDGICKSTHGDYANTKVIIPRIKALHPKAQIFGYVSTNQSYSNFKTKVDDCLNSDFSVDGIFFDEHGYDFGTTSTNSRVEQNKKLDYVHSKGIKAFLNSWNSDHALTVIESDATYPNSTWNPDSLQANFNADDWYLLEGHAITALAGYESKTQWYDRGSKLDGININIAAVSVISDTDTNGQDKFDFAYTSSLMFAWDAVGSSDTAYGATNSRTKLWDRIPISGLKIDHDATIGNDSNTYIRYLHGGYFKLDFTSGSESSEVVIY